MAVVICVKDARVKGYVSVGVKEDGNVRYFTVSKIEYSSLGSPGRGEELDGQTVDTLFTLDEEFRAMRKALSLLSFSDNSERMLRLKLSRAGFPRDAADKAVTECVSLGYVDEKRQLRRLIPTLAGKLHGPLFIKQALLKKGYSSADISEIIDELTSDGELNLEENFERLVEKYQPEGDEERRILAHKYGFRY